MRTNVSRETFAQTQVSPNRPHPAKVRPIRMCGFFGRQGRRLSWRARRSPVGDAASAGGRAAHLVEALPHLAGALPHLAGMLPHLAGMPPRLAGALSRVPGDRRRFASAKRQMVSTAAKASPAAAARAAAAGFSTTRDHPIVACVASSPPASLVFTALIQLADSPAALDSRWKRWQTAGNPRWKTWQETWNPREIGVRNGQG